MKYKECLYEMFRQLINKLNQPIDFSIINLYNVIKEENAFGQWTDFARMLKGDIDRKFAVRRHKEELCGKNLYLYS